MERLTNHPSKEMKADMKEFRKTLASINIDLPKGSKKAPAMDTKKVLALSPEVKAKMTDQLVSLRLPIVAEFIGPNTDISWLNAMGYLYTTTGKVSGYTFRHTCEHSIK